MGTKQVRLDEDVYAKIKDKKRPDESFSDAIDRLTSDWSLAEWGKRHEADPQALETARETRRAVEETTRGNFEETLAMLTETDE